MDSQLFIQALKASKARQKYAFATIVESTVKGTPRKVGAKMIVWEDGSLFGSIGGGRNELAAKKECLKAIRSGRPSVVVYNYFGEKGQSICGGQIKVFIEPFKPQKHLIICGAGHIGLSLSMIGKILGYKVTIIDTRRSFANPKRFAHVDHILVGAYATKLKKVPIDQDTYIMIVTQGNEYDFECLKQVIDSQAGYIGVISSKRKRQLFFDRLIQEGVTKKILKRIDIPAGINLGAQNPQEIAVSIAAKLVQTENKSFLVSEKFLT